MLKVDLHIHSKEDKIDDIGYSAKQIIDKAARLKFDVLAFTLHDYFLWDDELVKYAKDKGIILIPGVEIKMREGEVLMYNIKKEYMGQLKTLADIRKLKRKDKNIFVIAPHPYYFIAQCLRKDLEKNIDVFDAIEHSWFYTQLVNCNRKAAKTARRYRLPLVANSDCHFLHFFGRTYSLVDSKKDIKSVFSSIKRNKVKICSKPLNPFVFLFHAMRITFEKIWSVVTK